MAGPAGRRFVIDTSAIIEPRRLLSQASGTEKNRVYVELGRLVEAGALLFPHEVYEELLRGHDPDKDDRPFDWAHKHKNNADGVISLPEMFEAVRDVNVEVDNLVDYDKTTPGEDADPWVVGLALHLARLDYDVTVITEDRTDQPEKTSMVSACGVLRIPSFSLRAFLRHMGIWPRQ